MVKVFQDTAADVVGFTGYSDKGIFVVFRGSDNLDNWISNIEVAQVNYPQCSGCQVHDGFYKAWLAVSDQVKSQVQ